jgi:S-methylmethionine-dependent homocysteine/selenocysteine methylase
MNESFVAALADERLLVLDGGLSTALEGRGHQVGGALWTARLVLEAPDEVVAAHRSFVEAGADVVISAAYQASEEGFVRAGASPAAARQALLSTTELARRSGARFVAASVGPFGAMLADGSEYTGRYHASWADVRRVHRRRLAVLVESAPDVFAVETMPTEAEAEIVLELLEDLGAGPTWLSMSRTAELEAVAALADEAVGVVAVGVNCVPAADVGPALMRLAAVTRLPLVAYPNGGGVWDADAKCWLGDDAGVTTELMRQWQQLGARLIGGCCGTSPAALAALVPGDA